MPGGQQEAAVSPAMSSGVCYLQENAYHDQLETVQQAMQQCHGTSLKYDHEICCVKIGFPVYYEQLQTLHQNTTRIAIP